MPTTHPASWNRVMIDRYDDLIQLRAKGIDPFKPTKFVKTHTNADIRRICETALEREEALPTEISLAGRIISIRKMGKLIFADVEDESGRIQFMIKKDQVGEDAFAVFSAHLDLGDYIGGHGAMLKTRSGEISLEVKS